MVSVPEHATFLPAGDYAPAGLEPGTGFAYQVAMEEPSATSSRQWLAGILVSAILVGGAGFLLGRGTAERTQVVTAPPPAASSPGPKPTPAPKPALPAVLGRSEIIALAASAADAAAGGRSGGDAATLDGR